MPKAHESTFKGQYFFVLSESYGAMKFGVPHWRSALETAVEKPKSIILTFIEGSSSKPSRMLSGFMSLWAIPSE